MIDYIRQMCREDIEQVSEIDREAFPTEWPPPNLGRELENRLAHYLVACQAAALPEVPKGAPAQRKLIRLRSWMMRLLTKERLPDSLPSVANEYIAGFAGFWVMADEAHIITIATRQAFQRQGIGELLLQAIIDMSIQYKARIVTLEVRVSNTPAQKLYAKYGFGQVGLRHGYYANDREDAIIMSTDHITSPAFRAQLKEQKSAYTARWGQDRYRLRA